MSRQLAIMSEPEFGMRDMFEPGFWFSVKFGADLSEGALIIMSVIHFSEMIKEEGIYSLKSLKDSPCQIDVTDNAVTFVKVLK